MRREKQLHDAQPWFRAHRGEHVGISCDLLRIGFPCHGSPFYLSIIMELWRNCQGGRARRSGSFCEPLITHDRVARTLLSAPTAKLLQTRGQECPRYTLSLSFSETDPLPGPNPEHRVAPGL